MELVDKRESFRLSGPIGEPELVDGYIKAYGANNYFADRKVEEDGTIIWIGLNTNWKKEKDGEWHKLVGQYFVPCEVPKYEVLYANLEE